ncbi:Sh2 Domain-Containing Protein 4A [Manis pentadactyla]|nr:Sh2 Domain-Containing Protein 4A [Manis pentadactyla]
MTSKVLGLVLAFHHQIKVLKAEGGEISGVGDGWRAELRKSREAASARRAWIPASQNRSRVLAAAASGGRGPVARPLCGSAGSSRQETPLDLPGAAGPCSRLSLSKPASGRSFPEGRCCKLQTVTLS